MHSCYCRAGRCNYVFVGMSTLKLLFCIRKSTGSSWQRAMLCGEVACLVAHSWALWMHLFVMGGRYGKLTGLDARDALAILF